ncbi:lamin tail domain-containing protein [Methanophagales archaeon]|nr:MAG: lamin tail domain-containing protein [Methanophagales archaeon]
MNDKKGSRAKIVVIVATAILVLMFMLPVMVSAQSEININEIMYNPSTDQGDDSDMEWIELYNNDTEAINISDWTIDNNPISDNVMQPGDYVVLARNKTAFEDYYGALPCSVVDVTFVLANSGDTIVLCNSSGSEVDNVTYNTSWGADGNGRTLELNATGGWEESLVDGGTPCQRNSVLGTPPQVTNASANPPVIVVNTDITELRVDAAGIEGPIDVVTVDLSPIGGNASTVMFNIGNYTQDNVSWTMYNYTTNASVVGTFNLTVNATDINGNYNDTVSITLDVKKTVIHFPTFLAMSYISNISFDANTPGNVGKNATTEQFTSTEEIDNETYYIVNTTKPVGSTKMYAGVDVANEDLTMKRRVREREPGVEVANLTFNPAFVSRDFPLWVGKNWTTTTNVTGMLVNGTGAVILIDTIAVVSGAVTDEVNITVPYGTIHCLVVEVNVNLQNPPKSFLTRYWMGYDETSEMLIIPKSQRYSNGNLREELELMEIVAP